MEAGTGLARLRFDPLADIHCLTSAGPVTDPTLGDNHIILVISGRFDSKKITAALDTAIKKDSKKIITLLEETTGTFKATTVREGSVTLFKGLFFTQTVSEPVAIYFAFADDKRLVASPNRKLLANTLQRAAKGEKWRIEKKQVADALANVDKNSTFYLYALGGLSAGIPGRVLENQEIAKLLDKIVLSSLDLRVAEGLQMTATFRMKDVDAAKQLKLFVDPYILQFKTLIPLLIGPHAALKPLGESVNSLKTAAKGTTFVVNGEITGRVFEEIEKGIALGPKNAATHNDLGLALQGKNQLDDAIAEYRKAIALDPKNVLAHCNLGFALEAKNQLDGAIAAFNKAISLDPKNAAAHNGLGFALQGKNQLDDAIAAYRKAIALDPKSVMPHCNLGFALQANNQLDDAIAAFNKAIEIVPKFAMAHNGLGFALQGKNQLDDAIAEYNKAIALEPNNVLAHFNLGFALKVKNQLDGAIAAYRKAIALDPKNAAAHFNLGLALQAKNQLDDAIAAFKMAISLDPKNAAAHNGLGWTLQAKNQLDDAIAAFNKAIALDPKNADAHNGFGWALQAKNQLDDAIAEYRKAIALDPNNVLAHCNLGFALEAKNQLDDAIAAFNKAIEIAPKFPMAHGGLGLALLEKGQFAEAKTSLQKALDLLPEKDPQRTMILLRRDKCDALLALERQLPDIVAGKTQPKGNSQRLDFIKICQYQLRHAAAAKLFREAFTADAKLADDLHAGHRYDAACSAALSAAGQAKDADKLTDQERADLRNQALQWLRRSCRVGQAARQRRRQGPACGATRNDPLETGHRPGQHARPEGAGETAVRGTRRLAEAVEGCGHPAGQGPGKEIASVFGANCKGTPAAFQGSEGRQ